MKAVIGFGCICFAMSIGLCAIQLVPLLGASSVDGSRLLLQFLSTAATLLFGLLAAFSSQKAVTNAISLTAFGVCLLSLIAAGFLATTETSEITPVKYVVIAAYAASYGIVGLVFAMLTARTASKGKDGEPLLR